MSLAKTVDQAHAVMTFLDCVSERNYKATIALTAARGRGKSAAIGLCLAGQWEVLSLGVVILCVLVCIVIFITPAMHRCIQL